MTRYAKAVLAALLAVSTWGVTAAVDGAFDAVEWFGLLGAVATAVGTYLVPNTPPAGKLPRDDISEQHQVDAGHSDMSTAVVVVLLIIVVFLLVL